MATDSSELLSALSSPEPIASESSSEVALDLPSSSSAAAAAFSPGSSASGEKKKKKKEQKKKAKKRKAAQKKDTAKPDASSAVSTDASSGASPEVKRQKETLYSIFGDVTELEFDVLKKPPKLGGLSQKIPSKQFLKDKKIKYAGTIFLGSEKDFKKLQTYSQAFLMKNVKLHLVQGMTSTALKEKSLDTSRKIQLADIGEEVSFSAFAKERIREGSLILYGGRGHFFKRSDLLNKQHVSESQYHLHFEDFDDNNPEQEIFVVSAFEYRDFPAWFSHAEDTETLAEIEFDNEFLRDKALPPSFESQLIYLTDMKIIVMALKALRDIAPGEILTFHYPDHFKGSRPRLCDKIGRLIPEEQYRYLKGTLSIDFIGAEKITAGFYTTKAELNEFLQIPFSNVRFGDATSLLVCYVEKSEILQALKKKGGEKWQVSTELWLNEVRVKEIIAKLSEKLGIKADIDSDVTHGWKMEFRDRRVPMLSYKKAFPFSDINQHAALTSYLTICHSIPKAGLQDLMRVSLTHDKKDMHLIFEINEEQCFELGRIFGIIKTNIKPGCRSLDLKEQSDAPFFPLYDATKAKERHDTVSKPLDNDRPSASSVSIPSDKEKDTQADKGKPVQGDSSNAKSKPVETKKV